MPRKHQVLIPNEPYFISARCINREWFRIPIDEVWDLFSNYLFFIHHAFDARIFGFVLMSNHFHILMKAPDLSDTMNYFMRETSRIISRRSGRINQIYGGPYHKSLVNTPFAFPSAYKYLYRNPVDAKMCIKVEEYRYSTLRCLLGYEHGIIPVEEDTILFESPGSTIEWLNFEYEGDDRQKLKKALSTGTLIDYANTSPQDGFSSGIFRDVGVSKLSNSQLKT